MILFSTVLQRAWGGGIHRGRTCHCHQPVLPASHSPSLAEHGTCCPQPQLHPEPTDPQSGNTHRSPTLQPQTPWAESSRSRAPAQPCPPTLAPAFPLHKWRRPGHGSLRHRKATMGAGTWFLPPTCPGKGPAGPEEGQLPTRAGQVPAAPGLLRAAQTAAAAPGLG